jgi:pseudouridine-5'-phosphate glycosidase
MNPLLAVAPRVSEALEAGRPVVALESTLITHGFAHPMGVAAARNAEAAVRAAGAEPATVAVAGGRLLVGLSDDELEQIATASAPAKASRATLALALAGGGWAGTTVSATMIAASLAGIRVFATGGIGGVHRGASTSFDISADLTELAVTPVAVVSAGIKSILDIGLTLERLETLGVPVIVNGSDDFPSFYSRRSGLAAPRRVDGPAEIAAFMVAAWHTLGLTTGISIANPIPADDEIPVEQIQGVIDEALAELDARGIGGQDVTPFLLGRIVEQTDGRSLTANVALVKHNAAVAAQIAVEYAAFA